MRTFLLQPKVFTFKISFQFVWFSTFSFQCQTPDQFVLSKCARSSSTVATSWKGQKKLSQLFQPVHDLICILPLSNFTFKNINSRCYLVPSRSKKIPYMAHCKGRGSRSYSLALCLLVIGLAECLTHWYFNDWIPDAFAVPGGWMSASRNHFPSRSAMMVYVR